MSSRHFDRDTEAVTITADVAALHPEPRLRTGRGAIFYPHEITVGGGAGQEGNPITVTNAILVAVTPGTGGGHINKGPVYVWIEGWDGLTATKR